MSTDDRIPFNDEPRGRPDFEIDEEALQQPGTFWQTDADQATKVLPAYDGDQQATQALGAQPPPRAAPRPAPQHAPDAPTQRLGTMPPRPQQFRPAQQQPTAEPYEAYGGNAEYTAPHARHADAGPSRFELGAGGWLRLLLGGTLLLASTWLLVHGAHGTLAGDAPDALLNPFTLVGGPLLLGGILLLPGPAGGKVAGIVLAAFSYAALLSPALLGEALGAFASPLSAFIFGPACALFGFMTWLGVRGKRPLAWVLIVVPPAIAIVWAALATASVGGVLFAGAAPIGDAPEAFWLALLPEAQQGWLLALADGMAESTIRWVALGLCVVPAMLLAWPFQRASLVRSELTRY